MSEAFGPHLTVDMRSCGCDVLEDLKFWYRFLDDLCNVIEMRRIAPPYVFEYEGVVPEDRGISGFLLVAESHVSIHTFCEKGWAFIDVFSCKPFNTALVEEFIRDRLPYGEAVVKCVERGIGFPREP